MLFSSKHTFSCLASISLFYLAASTDVHDVIIVGAGWSGLAAANYLKEAGITENFLLLEARDRIGGRSYTREDVFETGHPVELGSAWIYPDTNVFELVQKLGIEHDTTHFFFNTLGLFNSTSELSDDAKSSLVDDAFLSDFVTYAGNMASNGVSWTDITESYFADHWDLTNSTRQGINALVHAGINIEFGCPLNDTNTATTKDYLARGSWRDIEFMPVAGGTGGGYTGALTRGLAEAFKNRIKASTPVVKIDYGGEVVEVYAASGEVFFSRSVVVTVPLGVLKKSAIEFVPPLNDEKLEAIDLIGMGNMNKVIMHWDNATQNISWWPEDKIDMQLITEQDSDSGDWTYFYNEQSHEANKDYHVLTAWCGGDSCDRLEKDTDEETIAKVLRNLRKMFGNGVPAPSEYIITRWGSEEYSGGAYSYDTVGVDLPSYRNALFEPIGNLYFAGEATDSDWFGTAVGAYTSGVKAASRISDSGVLDMPPPDVRPVCTRLYEGCGGVYDRPCCSGLSCVYDRRSPIAFGSMRDEFSILSRTTGKICSATQRDRNRESKRLGSISLAHRASRTGVP